MSVVATGQVPLARFARNWVGGNIDSLAQLAHTLYGYALQITGVASTLDTQVRQVVGAAGWKGSAAAAFTSAWGWDSVTARAVGLASDQIPMGEAAQKAMKALQGAGAHVKTGGGAHARTGDDDAELSRAK